MKLLLLLFFVSFFLSNYANHPPIVKGIITDELGNALYGATIYCPQNKEGIVSNLNGEFRLPVLIDSMAMVQISYVGYYSRYLTVCELKKQHGRITLFPETKQLQEVIVSADRTNTNGKYNSIIRLPIDPQSTVQGIATIANDIIEKQGALMLSEVARNVVGMSTFATYGNTSESLSTRGFRGIPTLKNGVRVQSDFRGQGFLNDMQGVEAVQVIKGISSVSQGLGNDLGSAAGVINIITKTPQFLNAARLSLRTGSWGLIRPTFDIQSKFARHDQIGVRLNGAYEYSGSYRKSISKNRIYLNPSLIWCLNEKTELIAEMDYLHDVRTPDRGTVNLNVDSVNALYSMPYNKFLGFKTDKFYSDNLTFSGRLKYNLTNNIYMQIAVMGSNLSVDNSGASTKIIKYNGEPIKYNLRQRLIGRSTRKDNNRAIQFDVAGKEVSTWGIGHTFQLGMDYKYGEVISTSYQSVVVDTIDVLQAIPNHLPQTMNLISLNPSSSITHSYGFTIQDMIRFNRYVQVILGGRYSYAHSRTDNSPTTLSDGALNPLVGVMITPYDGINMFGSYSASTDTRSASNLMTDDTPIGASTTEQFEIGFKTSWLKKRLILNTTLFSVTSKNMIYELYDDAGQKTNRYDRAGDLRRKGVEIELRGFVRNNLEIIAGYAFLDARYCNSPAYVEGSAPMNSPRHTANGWIHYRLLRGIMSGLSIGVGAYYIGERPVGEYTLKTMHINTQAGIKPFDMDDYFTLNLSAAYRYKNISCTCLLNNLLDGEGYTSYYRGGYINPIDPLNVSVSIGYNFK